MDTEPAEPMETSEPTSKRERSFPALDLKDQSTLSTQTQPVLVVQSPKTPTLSRKLKAISLDSEPQPQVNTLEVSRDVFSMPNTPKRQIKQKLSCDFDEDGDVPKGTTITIGCHNNNNNNSATLAPSFSSNLKKFASNNSISGSQTLKTLPEINALQDFSDCPPNPEPQKVRAKGLLERRGSNASLTIDLGSAQNIAEAKPVMPFNRLNTAKSVSNLYSSSMGSIEKCVCVKKGADGAKVPCDRWKAQEPCGNCTIYESEPKVSTGKSRYQNLKRCHCCAKSRRKSLSNENLYVPPCSYCGEGEKKEGANLRQPDLDSTQLHSDYVKLHIQNIQYLQTACKTMGIDDLRQSCEISKVPKLQQEFWEVPLNLQEKCYVSGSQCKNRYRSVLPNEHSRVHLPNSTGYIHANYIKGPDYMEAAYIATQGPLANTCTDFWEMVWHTECKCIVMLTGLYEKGRNKCELYFPLGKPSDAQEKTYFYVKTPKIRDKFTFDSSGANAGNAATNSSNYEIETYKFEEKNEVTFGRYRIQYLNQRKLDDCQVRQLEVSRIDSGAKPRTVFHYWLSNWPDHKRTNAEQVLKMAVDVLECLENAKSDISESLSTCANPVDVQQVSDLNKEQGATLQASTSHAGGLNYQTSNCETSISTPTAETTTRERFDFDAKTTAPSEASPSDSSQLRHKESDTASSSSKPREDSISEFSKETLANRCSLDSKLQDLNKMSGLKGSFKGTLKTKSNGVERKKSTELVKLPIVVHCSAGIGRTGCFLAILNGIQQLRQNRTVDVLAILCSLRLNRGGMVQTAEQYELIHRVLSLYSETHL